MVPVARRRIAPFIVLAVALVAGVLFFLLADSEPRKNQEDTSTPLLGQAAPLFAGDTLDGGTFDIVAQRGRVVVVNFFTSSCGPCKLEHPELVRFAAEQAALPDGAVFVTVTVNDRVEDVKAFFAEFGGDWPVVFAEGASGKYGVSLVPETWLIDRSGTVVKRMISETTRDCLTASVAEITNGVPVPKGVCA